MTPLTDGEADALARSIGRAIPDEIVRLLKAVGSPQNVCHDLFREVDYVNYQNWVSPEHFAFAMFEDYGVYAVGLNGEVSRFVNDSREAVLVSETLDAWLVENAIELSVGAEPRWQLQLAFTTGNESGVLDLLQQTFGIDEQLTDWQFAGVSPAKVSTYTRTGRTIDGPVQIKRQEYEGWDTPAFYFDRQVVPSDIRRVKDATAEFAMADVGFTLIEYGVF